MARAYISIGTNIERETNIRSALRTLHDRFGPLRLSSVYDCPPVGFEGDNFYNLVAGLDTDLPVEHLIRELHDIEQAHGRKRSGQRFGPRTLDLDLLLYDDLVRHDGTVDVPRREILEYGFVLQPLAEIAPQLQHPEVNQPIAAIWSARRQQMRPLARTGFDPLK